MLINPSRLILTLSLTLSPLAHAVLGEAPAVTVKSSQLSFNRYTRFESAEQKLTVHQFAGATGKIFAVAWRGKVHPDLKELLGSHFAEFQAAYKEAKKIRRGHSPIEIETGNIHVEMGGFGGAMVGRVWLKNQVPERVDTSDLR